MLNKTELSSGKEHQSQENVSTLLSEVLLKMEKVSNHDNHYQPYLWMSTLVPLLHLLLHFLLAALPTERMSQKRY